ncbi:22878_t:CDS:2, partial [Entrophospora sp. SA101]
PSLTYGHNFSALPTTNNQNDFSTLPLTNNFHRHSNENTLAFPIYQNIVSATKSTRVAANVDTTTTIADNNNMKPLVSTPLLNNPSYENNNNIIWLLTRLEKRINQMEQNIHQKIFASNTLSQNNAFDNGNKISNDDIYNILGKLFTRIEQLETSQINVERNLAELNKFYFNQN